MPELADEYTLNRRVASRNSDALSRVRAGAFTQVRLVSGYTIDRSIDFAGETFLPSEMSTSLPPSPTQPQDDPAPPLVDAGVS